MSSTTKDTRPLLRPELLVEPVGEDVLVLDPDSESMYQLNRTAGAVIELCDGTRTVDQIVEILHDRFRAPDPERLQRDVADTLEQMQDLGLLETVDGERS